MRDVPLNSTTETTRVVDHQTPLGTTNDPATTISHTIPLLLNKAVQVASYQMLQQAALEAVAGTRLLFWRETPVVDGSAQAPEVFAGRAQVTDTTETNAAGQNDADQVSFTLTVEDGVNWTKQGGAGTGAILTLSVVNGGADLTAGSGIQVIGGGGYGATVDLTVATGAVTGATVAVGGTNYAVDDLLTILDPTVLTLPTSAAPTLKVDTVTT